MALTVYNKSGLTDPITATLSASQSDQIDNNGSWQPSGDPTQFTLNISANDGAIKASKSFGPEITSATFQRTGQVFGIILA